MRRLPALLLAASLIAPTAVALPAVSLPAARPHPIAPSVTKVTVSGVEQGVLGSGDDGSAAAGAAAAEADAVGPVAGLAGRVRAAASGTARTVILTGQRRAAPFASVGVTWDRLPAGSRSDLVVLARTLCGPAWSGWTALGTEEVDAADPDGPASQRSGTEPLWVGRCTGVQVRVDLRSGPVPTGVRVELIDPGNSDYDRQVGAVPPGSAAAQATTPGIYSRAAWGADESRVRAAATLMPGLAAAVIHHTVDTNSYTAAQVPAMIRADYAYHLSLGWNDIGYNFLVDRFGRIWEGRRGGVTAAVQGAHAGGFNNLTFGVALIGNYETATPSSGAVSALERLIAWKLDLNHVDPLGVTALTSSGYSGARWAAGTAVRLPTVLGHRDLGYTACPGIRAYRLIPQIRSGAATLMRAALVTPGISSRTGPAGSAGTRITARTTAAQSWRLTVSDCGGGTFTHQDGISPARGVLVAQWDGRRGAAQANPGVYDLWLTSRNRESWARSLAWSYVVTAPAPGSPPSGPTATGSGELVPVPAVRLLDSRTGPPLATGPGGRVDLAVTGRGGIPGSGVLAVVLQVTAVCPSASTSLTVWPAGQDKPAAAAVTLPGRGTRTATTVVPVGAGGKVSIGNAAGVTGLLVDAVGYTVSSADQGAGGGLRTVTAGTRIFDSAASGGPLAAGTSREFTLPAAGGIATSRIRAVVTQIRTGGASQAGTVHLDGAGEAASAVPAARYEAGADTVTLAVVRPGAGARVVVGNTGPATVRVTVDVVGVVAGPASGDSRPAAELTALRPSRVYDSRSAGAGGALPASTAREVAVAGGQSPVPADATAVLVDLSGTAGSASSAVTAWAAGTTRPNRTDLALARGGSGTNLALVPLGTGGAVSVWGSGDLRSLAVDVVGYLR